MESTNFIKNANPLSNDFWIGYGKLASCNKIIVKTK